MEEIEKGLQDPDTETPGWATRLIAQVEHYQNLADSLDNGYNEDCLKEDLLIISDALDDILMIARKLQTIH